MSVMYQYQKYPVNLDNLYSEIDTALSLKVVRSLEADIVDGAVIYSAEDVVNNLCINFDVALSAEDKTTLDQVITDHTG